VLNFSVDPGSEGEWPFVGCLTVCTVVNRSGAAVLLYLVIVGLGYRR